jgi:hypothetical protein
VELRAKFFVSYVFCWVFGLFRNRSVCFGCFETGPKHRNKPKQTEKIVIGFAKQTENEPKQIEFRFVSVRTEKKICLFRGHPTGIDTRRLQSLLISILVNIVDFVFKF